MTRILFVEDEPWGVNAYFSILQRNDFECDLAEDFQNAVGKLQREKFDIISLDIMFSPGKNAQENIQPQSAGLRLLQSIRSAKIRNCDPGIEVVVLTALANDQIEKEIRKLGVSAYLTKPVAFDRVIDTFKVLQASNQGLIENKSFR